MTVVSQFLNIDCGLSCESPYCNFNHTQFGRLNKTYELSFLNLYVQSYGEKTFLFYIENQYLFEYFHIVVVDIL